MRRLANGPWLLAIGSGFALGAPTIGHALTIDNFEEGPFFLLSAGTDEQSGLAPGNVLGGVRHVTLGLLSGPSANGRLQLIVPDDSAYLTHPGFSATSSFLRFLYDGTAGGNGSLGVDLTADGASAFAITVSQSDPSSSVNVHVVDTFGGSQSFAVGAPVGVALIDFSLYGAVDLTRVESIRLTLNHSDTAGRTSLGVSHFATVPEPGVAFLLACGLVGLGLSRSGRR